LNTVSSSSPRARFSNTTATWQRLPLRNVVFFITRNSIYGLFLALFIGSIAIGIEVAVWAVTREQDSGHAFLAHLQSSNYIWIPLVGLLGGAWLGWRKYRLIFWRLDKQALGVRRGYLWHSESRVPISRVQHLDVRRGPVQRLFGLATLVVHTAGTQMNTVAIKGLLLDDAQHLRDRLAHQLDCDDAL